MFRAMDALFFFMYSMMAFSSVISRIYTFCAKVLHARSRGEDENIFLLQKKKKDEKVF